MNDKTITITAREAARRRMPLDGADAQALEGALAMTEQELAVAVAARAERKAFLCRVYAAGYSAGHADTVEGCASVHRSWISEEASEYADAVQELIGDEEEERDEMRERLVEPAENTRGWYWRAHEYDEAPCGPHETREAALADVLGRYRIGNAPPRVLVGRCALMSDEEWADVPSVEVSHG